jgi:hypothetical protein
MRDFPFRLVVMLKDSGRGTDTEASSAARVRKSGQRRTSRGCATGTPRSPSRNHNSPRRLEKNPMADELRRIESRIDFTRSIGVLSIFFLMLALNIAAFRLIYCSLEWPSSSLRASQVTHGSASRRNEHSSTPPPHGRRYSEPPSVPGSGRSRLLPRSLVLALRGGKGSRVGSRSSSLEDPRWRASSGTSSDPTPRG